MTLHLKSYNINLINKFYSKIIIKLVKKYKINLQGPVTLPSYKNEVVLIKSPHVNIKSKEKFETKKYHYIFYLNTTKNSILKLKQFQKILNCFLVTGLSLKIILN